MRSAIFPDEATSGLCDRDAGNRPPCGDLGRGRKEKARARHSSSGSKDGIPYCLGSSSWDVPTAANTLTPPSLVHTRSLPGSFCAEWYSPRVL